MNVTIKTNATTRVVKTSKLYVTFSPFFQNVTRYRALKLQYLILYTSQSVHFFHQTEHRILFYNNTNVNHFSLFLTYLEFCGVYIHSDINGCLPVCENMCINICLCLGVYDIIYTTTWIWQLQCRVMTS